MHNSEMDKLHFITTKVLQTEIIGDDKVVIVFRV